MRALITGASSGIGKDMAKYLSSLGFDLILVATNREKMEQLKEQLGTNIEIICMDLSIAENCIELYKTVGKIDVLINNAGIGMFGEFTKTNLIEEMNLININICALHLLTKLFLDEMGKENFGYIMNVSSIAGFFPGPLMATYYSSKAYVLRLTQSIAEELRQVDSGISISCLCPGPTDTDFLEKAGVKFKMQSLKSDYVAKYAIDKMLRGKLMIIPGIKIKIMMFLSRFVSDKILARIIYKTQEKRK